eukprot:CAMPEP_0184008428 /NCGR_PEP_ID=MMETSP0954-20121128/1966_1 /TAXON_ID=627963 /ORGANISM="Aplanochytrium sp, Strain PBS07" /LENGTH=422 /DNA_ID=CAMNT_0026287533 /DNA_START=258 /DNA_END=1523 /DNA_ORIENTATION=-
MKASRILRLLLIPLAATVVLCGSTCPGAGDLDFSLVLASCPDVSVTCVADRLVTTGSSCAAILEDFGECTDTVQDVLYNNPSACESVLANDTLCTISYGNLLHLGCDGRCPSGDNLDQFTPLVDCLIFETQGMSESELQSYRPYDCLLDDPDFDTNNDGNPDICEDGGSFAQFENCELPVETVIETIINETVGDSGLGNSCEELFRGDFLSDLCGKSLGEAIDIFCTPCDTLSCKVIFGMPGNVFVGIVAGGGGALLVLCSAIVIWRRKKSKRHNRAYFESNPADKYLSAMGGSGGVQVNAYEMTEKYKQQLLDFYIQNNWRDPSGNKSPSQQVDYLFENYDPPKIAVAIKRKYGYLPAGWDSMMTGVGTSPSNSGLSGVMSRQLSQPLTLSPTLSYSSGAPPGLSKQSSFRSKGSKDDDDW